MPIHDGHRERLRKTYLEYGLQSMNEINALELLLFYAIPRRDTNGMAHLLLDRFGSLDGVLKASIEELCEVEGIGTNAAALITLVPQLYKKSQIGKSRTIRQIHGTTEAGTFLLPYFQDEADEVVFLLCLDAKNCVICCTDMGHGVVDAVDISVRRIVEKALKVKASRVIVAHNHPDGFAIPSEEDIFFTRNLCNALMTVGIPLQDHIIVAGNDFVSIADTARAHMNRS